jgi:hypothetical protein
MSVFWTSIWHLGRGRSRVQRLERDRLREELGPPMFGVSPSKRQRGIVTLT